MTTYYARTIEDEVLEIQADSAQEAAEEYVRSGEWPEADETQWVPVRVWHEDADGNEIEDGEFNIPVHPRAPRCVDARGHEWIEDVRPQLHGGGVWYRYRCARCGLHRATDTYAHDPATGCDGCAVTYFFEMEG